MKAKIGIVCWTGVGLALSALTVASAQNTGDKVLKIVADAPMPGPAVRFDYQSLDAEHGQLYIAHMNADQLVVFDTQKRQVVANLDGFKRVHGVIAVPAINRVFASATGEHHVVSLDTVALKSVPMAGEVNYPDGLAYAPTTRRVFVSDEHGGVDAVFDADSNKLLTSIPLGGGAGNTVYDPVSRHILVAVHGKNELAEVDPEKMTIVAHHPLPGVKNPHGIALDVTRHLAFIAGEENHSLAVFDLNTMKLLSVHQVGDDPDVLAFDPGLKRLYVSSESGTVSVFSESGNDLRLLGQFNMPHAHTVSVDPMTHLVYFPLENVEGHPLLRIMQPGE
jgi:DNA-binding beta-propeller fold protein YncE